MTVANQLWPIIASTVLVPVAEYNQLKHALDLATKQNISLQHSVAVLRDEQENQRVLNQAMQAEIADRDRRIKE